MSKVALSSRITWIPDEVVPVSYLHEILLQHWVLSRGKVVGQLRVSGQRCGDFWF